VENIKTIPDIKNPIQTQINQMKKPIVDDSINKPLDYTGLEQFLLHTANFDNEFEAEFGTEENLRHLNERIKSLNSKVMQITQQVLDHKTTT